MEGEHVVVSVGSLCQMFEGGGGRKGVLSSYTPGRVFWSKSQQDDVRGECFDLVDGRVFEDFRLGMSRAWKFLDGQSVKDVCHCCLFVGLWNCSLE